MKPKIIITIVIGTAIALLYLIIFQNSVPNEIAKMQKELPMKIDDGMMLTEVYELGKTVYYVVVVDTDMSREDLQISQYDIDSEKRDLIVQFRREMGRDMYQFKQMINGVVYLYKNNNGDELFRININKNEL